MADPVVIANWCGALEGLQVSPKDFYKSVADAVKKRSVPDCEMGIATLKEGGIFSSSREYFRVKRKDLYFDICGAPFGNSFFVSWWLVSEQSSGFLASVFKPDTYYKLDTAAMFRTLVHNSVMEAIDQMTQAKGAKALSELEKKPVLRDFYQR